jgi:hypothetical protein
MGRDAREAEEFSELQNGTTTSTKFNETDELITNFFKQTRYLLQAHKHHTRHSLNFSLFIK